MTIGLSVQENLKIDFQDGGHGSCPNTSYQVSRQLASSFTHAKTGQQKGGYFFALNHTKTAFNNFVKKCIHKPQSQKMYT